MSLTWHSALFPDLPRGGEAERRRGVALSCKGKRKQRDKTKISLRWYHAQVQTGGQAEDERP